MSDLSRRCDMLRWKSAEHAIHRAVRAVELSGADVRLTDAVVLLQAAKDSVADFVDGIESRRVVADPDRLASLERELAEARAQLSASHDVRDVFARDLNRMVEDCEKEAAGHDAIVASLTDELRRAKAKAEQYQIDWMAAKAEFGDKITALRQRHAEAVEKAYREGLREPFGDPDEYSLSDDELWLASEAKKGLEAWARREP